MHASFPAKIDNLMRPVRAMRQGIGRTMPRPGRGFVLILSVFLGSAVRAEHPLESRFQNEIEPLLVEYCHGCHGDGMKKGGVTLDVLASGESLLDEAGSVGVGAQKRPRRNHASLRKAAAVAKDMRLLADWIKRDILELDPLDPDPGRVTIRRLNRVEYRNTIRDLTGFDFKAEEEFPPDDTGYGFDTIGDVLSVSPLLLEKYMQAAESIVAAAVPTASKVIPERSFVDPSFKPPMGAVAAID